MASKGYVMGTRVTYRAGYTRNLQNFESARIDFGIESDEIKEGESINDFKARLKAKVDSWVEEAVEEVDREAANRSE
jgi:hypothetical protein